MSNTLNQLFFKLRQQFFRAGFRWLPANFLNPSESLKKRTLVPCDFMNCGSVLFVGHDANLAGAQVLLLSLIKWINQNTGITIKLILLDGGLLFNQFEQLAKTVVWKDLLKQHPDIIKRKKWLTGFVGKTDIIYGNSILSAAIYDELKFLDVPYISHIHELEKSIQSYVGKSTIQKMIRYTGKYIACSTPVSINLHKNHHINPKKISIVHEFIERMELEFNSPINICRKKLGLVEDGLIVFGCGTVCWRKGVDIFIDTASLLKTCGLKNFHFYWIGKNLWDVDPVSSSRYFWSSLAKKMEDNGLTGCITFLGVKENVMEYFLAGDVFYLPSREDPFPLVCLEAAQCGLPVICFEEAGGMPDFVENNAGYTVPFENISKVVEKLMFLHENKQKLEELGIAARHKLLNRHLVEIAAPQILDICQNLHNQHYKLLS